MISDDDAPFEQLLSEKKTEGSTSTSIYVLMHLLRVYI